MADVPSDAAAAILALGALAQFLVQSERTRSPERISIVLWEPHLSQLVSNSEALSSGLFSRPRSHTTGNTNFVEFSMLHRGEEMLM